MIHLVEEYLLPDAGAFPNSIMPVIVYRAVAKRWLPSMLLKEYFKHLFSRNDWSNNAYSKLDALHHYHSNTHKVMGVFRGSIHVLIGGGNGIELSLQKGDVVIIPAGVACKNMQRHATVQCVTGYPDGRQCDIKYGESYERPMADLNIAVIDTPITDPVLGEHAGVAITWEHHLTTLLEQPVYD